MAVSPSAPTYGQRECTHFAARVPVVHGPPRESLEQLLQQVQIPVNDRVRCELEHGEFVSRVVQAGREVQLVRSEHLAIVERVDCLQVRPDQLRVRTAAWDRPPYLRLVHPRHRYFQTAHQSPCHPVV